VRVRGKPRIPRHIYELQQSPSNDNRLHQRHVVKHRQRDRRLTMLERRIKRAQQESRRSFDQAYLEQTGAIRRRTRDDIRAANRRIGKKYDRKWDRLLEAHRAEISEHERRERSWIGRQKNRLESFSSIDLRGLVRGVQRKRVLGDVFAVFTRPGAGIELLKRRLHREAVCLQREKAIEEARARAQCLEDEAVRLGDHRGRYLRERASLLRDQRRVWERIRRLRGRQRAARIAAFRSCRDIDHVQAQTATDDHAHMAEAFRRSASAPADAAQPPDDERERRIEETRQRLEQERTQRERRPRKPRRKR